MDLISYSVLEADFLLVYLMSWKDQDFNFQTLKCHENVLKNEA